MFKFRQTLALVILSSFLVACASWFSTSSTTNKELNSPTVGSRNSSDFLFGQAASSPSSLKEDNGVAPMVAKPAKASAAK